MNKTIFIYDMSVETTSQFEQANPNIKVVCYKETLPLQIDCIKHQDGNLTVFINPNTPTKTGNPSIQNLLHFLRAARPDLEIYFVFDTQKQLEFYQKNI